MRIRDERIVAAVFRSILAVVAGGIGTIIVVLIVARVWPEMGQLKTLNVPFQETV